MASSYTHTTALKIYAEIAASGDRGIDIEQLHQATGLAKNTLVTYGRIMADEGAIDIQAAHSEAVNRPLKNVYFAICEPRPRTTDAERLKEVQTILEPFRQPSVSQSWDKGYKSDIVDAIQRAIAATL